MNSKIAQCPAAVREELNRRLFDGASTAKALAWLNGLPEVQEVVADKEFGGKAINRFNLDSWREGGYEEWRKERVAGDRIERLGKHALELGAKGNGMAQGCAALLAGEILQRLLSLEERSAVSDQQSASKRGGEGVIRGDVSERSGVSDQRSASVGERLTVKELGELTKMVERLQRVELEPRRVAQKDRWMGIKESEISLKRSTLNVQRPTLNEEEAEEAEREGEVKCGVAEQSAVSDQASAAYWEPVVGPDGELKASPGMEALREKMFGKEDAFGFIPWIEGESQGPRLPEGYVYTPTGWVPGDSAEAKAYAEAEAAKAAKSGEVIGNQLSVTERSGDTETRGHGDAETPPAAVDQSSVISDQTSVPSQNEQTETRAEGGCFEVAGGDAAMVVSSDQASAVSDQQSAPNQPEKTAEELKIERMVEEREIRYAARLAAFRKECARRDPFKEFRRGYVPPWG